jgi:hypothetical protein
LKGISMDDLDLEYAEFWVRVESNFINCLLMIITLPLLISLYGCDYFGSNMSIARPACFLINYVFFLG